MLFNNAIFQPQSDIVGAFASGLCAVHCIATPFLFVAQTCPVTGCCESSPGWWSNLDYIFIGITFFAVYFSAKNSGRQLMKYALYTGWVVLTLLVVNEKLAFLPIAETWKYVSAFSLIGLHFYNLKYCKCADDNCCVEA
ncbi:MAG: MerC domain-containing protein [Bacteroidota bacterium]